MTLQNPELRFQDVNKAFDVDGKFVRVSPVDPDGLLSGGAIRQVVSDVSSVADIAGTYTAVLAPEDFLIRKATSNGQLVVGLSVSPLTEDSESTITTVASVKAPCNLDVEASMSQRVRHQFAALCLFGDDPVTGADPVPADIQINTVYQSSSDGGTAYNATAGTILTLVLNSPFMGYLSDWVHVYGLADSRFNYPNLCVKYISLDRKTITCGFSDEAALPSLAATFSPTAGTAFIRHYNNLAGAHEGVGIRFTSSTATTAVALSLFGNNDVQVSGTLVGDHRVTFNSTNPIYLGGVSGQVEVKASSRYRFEVRPSDVAILDRTADSATQYGARAVRSAVKPSDTLKARFRAYRPKSATRPVAKIVSVAKTGTTTATVTLDRTCAEAGIVNGSYVTGKGVRDATNFPILTTPVVASAVSGNTFQLVWGSAVTATGYGGSIVLCNGGIDGQGFQAVNVNSAAYDATADTVTLVGSGSWNTTVGTGVNVSDHVELFGLRVDGTGADLAIDGTWEVAHIFTSTLVLVPAFDIAGTRRSPAAVGTFTTTNCGGCVIQRTMLRAHDLLMEDVVGESQVKIDGQGSTRADRAVPAHIVNTSITANQGSAASLSSTDGSGGWYTRLPVTSIPDVASAAITSTQTSSAISNNGVGGSYQVYNPVTGISGTGPRIYTRVQESVDGGSTWFNVYDLAPLGAVAADNCTPMLPILMGRTIRYVRKVVGTSPSITNSVSRILNGTTQAKIQRQMFDSVVSLTALTASTEWLYTEGCRNGRIWLSLAAATTAPTLKLQGCDGNPNVATNWYDISGATVAGVANSTVSSAVFTLPNCRYVRFVPTIVGSGITADTYDLGVKAWE